MMWNKCFGFVFLPVFLFFAVLSFAPLPSAASEVSVNELVVSVDAKAYILERQPVDTGEKYERQGDPSTVFLSDGRNATLKIEGKEYPQFVLLRDTTDEDELVITVDGVNYTMRQVITASGAKYEVPGNPQSFFWSKGPSAYLVIDGKEYTAYEAWLPSGTIWLPQSKPQEK